MGQDFSNHPADYVCIRPDSCSSYSPYLPPLLQGITTPEEWAQIAEKLNQVAIGGKQTMIFLVAIFIAIVFSAIIPAFGGVLFLVMFVGGIYYVFAVWRKQGDMVRDLNDNHFGGSMQYRASKHAKYIRIHMPTYRNYLNSRANGIQFSVAPQYVPQQNVQDLSNSGVPDIYETNLPPGWEARWDASTQKPYWVDHVNHMSSWVDPRQTYTAPPVMQPPSYNQVTTGTQVPLPFGWREATSPEGHVYYINDNLQITQWQRPT